MARMMYGRQSKIPKRLSIEQTERVTANSFTTRSLDVEYFVHLVQRNQDRSESVPLPTLDPQRWEGSLQ